MNNLLIKTAYQGNLKICQKCIVDKSFVASE